MLIVRHYLSACRAVAVCVTLPLSAAYGQGLTAPRLQAPATRPAAYTYDPGQSAMPPGVVRPAAYDEVEPAAPRPAPATPAAGPTNDKYIQLSFRLKHLPASDLEYHLLRLGVRPEANGDIPSDRYGSFRWKAGTSMAMGLRLDRKGNTIELEGMESTVRMWRNLITTLDAPADGNTTQVVPLVKADPTQVKQVLTMAQTVARQAGRGIPARPATLLQEGQPAPAPQPPMPMPAAGAGEEEEALGLEGPVQIEIFGDSIIVRGPKRSVERVQQLIEQIERQNLESQPDIEIVPMKHVDNRSLAELVVQVYGQVYSARQGAVTVIPLVKPNAVLVIGRKENIETVKGLVNKLDQPTPPQTQLKVFPLKNITAANAELTVRNFFVTRAGVGTDERAGLGTRVSLISDAHSNSLIVQAAPRDMLEVAQLLKSLDTDTNATKQEVRIFKLRNTLADDLAPVLQRSITGQGGTGAAAGGAQAAQNAGQGAAGQTSGRRPGSLQFLEIDGQQSRVLESGILTDMSITSDPRSNSLVITGPSKGMELMEALIRRLDELPSTEGQIKVFTIVNGDATTLANLLQQLFGQATQQQGAGGFGQFGAAGLNLNMQTAGGDGSLVPLRFSVDTRTNSIVASGSAGDLRVVHQILIRLDEGDIRDRVTTVYRLQNAPAADVSVAINQWLQGRRQINQLETQITSPFEQIEREVIVVPEVVSNSLIVSATPRYYEEVRKIVVDLDRRPPMVVIQVLIGEVQLDNVDELGVELGLQDSLLFDRGIGVPGFNFLGQPLGNQTTAQALATRDNVAGQATGTFNLGRTNTTLGYGGLVLSASSESVNILIRALQDSRRLQVISRPQVQTLDNQPAFVQVGARVPRITSSQLTNNGTINNTVLENVGILLGVTPRTSPDGLIVMEINAEKSELGPEAEGIPISINTNGDVIRSPQIKITTAQTTVSARSGQTVILGGLITQTRSETTRRVPYLADIPVLGRLFRFDSLTQQRKELLIIMTPYIMRTDEDVEWMNQRESERMSWCLADVANIHGETPLSGSPGGANPPPSSLIVPQSTMPIEQLPPGTLPPGAMPSVVVPPGVAPPSGTPSPITPPLNVRPRTEIVPSAADPPVLQPPAVQPPANTQPPANLPPPVAVPPALPPNGSSRRTQPELPPSARSQPTPALNAPTNAARTPVVSEAIELRSVPVPSANQPSAYAPPPGAVPVQQINYRLR